MARKIRIEYAGAAYHIIMARGNPGRQICQNERDRKLWPELGLNLKKSPADLQALTTIH